MHCAENVSNDITEDDEGNDGTYKLFHISLFEC